MWAGLSRAPGLSVNAVDLSDHLRKLWRQGLVPGSPAAYLFAVVCVAMATLARMVLGLIANDIIPLPTYYPAILVASLLGGAASGVLALVLGGIVGACAFMPPHYSIVVPSLSHTISLALYFGSAGVIICVAEGYRRAMRRVREEEAKRDLLVGELQHRSKNTMAVVQSIVSQSLRGNTKEAEKINRRINALAATDDLLVGSADQITDLKSILLTEFKPYPAQRIVMSGPRMSLAADLAKALALVFHELATNAVKYGSLSQPDGGLVVSWAVLGERAEIWWVEQGGPLVVPPTTQGFGTHFVGRILEALQGAVATEFRPNGVECKISFALPEPVVRAQL